MNGQKHAPIPVRKVIVTPPDKYDYNPQDTFNWVVVFIWSLFLLIFGTFCSIVGYILYINHIGG